MIQDQLLLLMEHYTREWIDTMVALHIIHELVEHSYLYTDILSKVDFVIVPVLNVDGYMYTHMIFNDYGVKQDPNRNFDYQWNTPGGTSTNPCSLSYRGTSPHSESEVAALAALMESGIALAIMCFIHMDGLLGVPVENSDEHHLLGVKFANAVRAVNGTSYIVGNSAASDDYAAGVGNAHLSYTLELPGGGPNGFDIEAHRIESVLAETFPGILVLLNYITVTFG